MMNKALSVVFLFVFFGAAAASEQPVMGNADLALSLESFTDAIQKALPIGWRVSEKKEAVHPPWSFSEQPVSSLILVGPSETGRRYFNDDQEHVATIMSMREAIEIWVATDTYDPGWTLWRRLKNSVTPSGFEYPEVIQVKNLKVFGKRIRHCIEPHCNETFPKGATRSVPLGLETTWATWAQDIMKAAADCQGEK